MKPKIGFIGLGIMGQYMANSAFSLSFPTLAGQLFNPKLPSDW